MDESDNYNELEKTIITEYETEYERINGRSLFVKKVGEDCYQFYRDDHESSDTFSLEDIQKAVNNLKQRIA
jgi:hypothetical protein